MRSTGWLFVALAAVLGPQATVLAQSKSSAGAPTAVIEVDRPDAPATGRAYAQYYGDGLRYFAEGEFNAAVDNLFRAYALRPKPMTLRLIVSSYDRMGFCDAASRQLDVYRRAHAGATVPQLQRCTSTGTVTLDCSEPDSDEIIVDRQFGVICGQPIALPVGEHRLTADHLEGDTEVVVRKDRSQKVELNFSPASTRWDLSSADAHVSRLSDGGRRVSQARVERLDQLGVGYTIFQSADGLYRVFVHPDRSTGPGRRPFSFRPHVLRLCDSGETFNRLAGRCMPTRGMKIRKMR